MDLVDTDVLIDVQRGLAAAQRWFATGHSVGIPGFVVMELVQDARNPEPTQDDADRSASRIRCMIINPAVHQRMETLEADESLCRMTPEESIAVGEAILTSELMQRADFPDDDHPRSLAITLGIQTGGLRRHHGGFKRV